MTALAWTLAALAMWAGTLGTVALWWPRPFGPIHVSPDGWIPRRYPS